MANIFYAFWEKINKKLVPRNVKFNETSSNYIFTLQNANGSEESTRENLVSFAVPKQYGLSEKDKAKLDKVWDMDAQLGGFTSEQWQTLVDVSHAFKGVNNNITTLKNQVDTLEGQVDTLEGETDKTDSKNEASSSSAGYMSATDKTALDTLKQYSQRYALIYATENSTQPDEYATIVLQTGEKTQYDQYGFKFNNVTFNKSIATIQEDQTRIKINQSGVYLILATGCILPQLQDWVTRQSNCFTMRIIHGKPTDSTPLAVDGEKVTGGRSIASSNAYFYENLYTSGTTFTVAKLEAGDMLSLIATIPVTARIQMRHYNSRIFLFNILSTQQSEFMPEDPVKLAPDADASGDDNNTQQEG